MLHQLAIAQLRRAGYRIFPPIPVPKQFSEWKPTAGSHARFVDECEDGRVTYYSCGTGEPPKSCSLATWRRWVQRTHARESEQ